MPRSHITKHNASALQPSDSDALEQATVPSSCRAYEKIRLFVDRYNRSTEREKVDSDNIIQKLKSGGVVNDEIISALTASDLAKLTELPEVVAKAMHTAIYDNTQQPAARTRPTQLRAQTMPLRQLLAEYDPFDFGSSVTRELKARLETAPHGVSEPRVIVFERDRIVDVVISESLISEYMQGDGVREYVNTSTGSRKTYAVGELPEQIVGVHPITGDDLRLSGEGLDGLNWGSCSLACQQMLNLAVLTGELDQNLNRRDLTYYHRIASDVQGGLAQLQNEFPQAATEFLRRVAVDDLPRLRRFRGAGSQSDHTDPAHLARGGEHTSKVRRSGEWR